MHRFLTYVLAVVFLALTSPAKAETIRLATEGAFAPYNFYQNGKLTGLDIELGDEICRRAGLTCEWVINDWDSIIDGLLANKYDAILAGMINTRSRRDRVAFSIGYEPSGGASIYVGTKSLINTETASIAVQANTVHETFLLDKGYEILTYPTAGGALMAVLEGQADLVFGGATNLEKEIFTTSRNLVIIARETIDTGAVSIAFRKSDEKLRAIFNGVINEMKQDGSLEEMRLKWFGAETDI